MNGGDAEGYRGYGWRARLGLIVPPTNTVNESEWRSLVPEGITIHSTRTPLHAANDPRLRSDLGVALDLLAQARPDVIAYGCTAGSLTEDLDEITGFMERRCGIPAVATGPAIVAALRALGAARVSLATPYHDALTRHEAEFFRYHGIETLASACLGYGANGVEEFRQIARVPPETVYRLARDVDRPDAEAVVISCTDLATVPILARLESDLGKPVVTSNHATLWAALRRAGDREPLRDCGRLLALAPGR